MGKRLGREFFERPAEIVAEQLLGKVICCRMDGQTTRYWIVETEAYGGEDDSACYGVDANGHVIPHYTGKASPLFESGGTLCVFADMLLIACDREGTPANVLVRAAASAGQWIEGPVNVCDYLGISGDVSGKDISTCEELWIEEPEEIPACVKTQRYYLGQGVRESDRERPWRFRKL